MAKKRIIGRIESLNTALWHEAIRIEKLKLRAEDLTAAIEEAHWASAPSGSLQKFRAMEFKLMEIESHLEELAWSLDEVVDDLTER
ncbi:hypothetical protein [Erythrobacter litoralis]|nr:hypothetical protein [Erythrobacter litoralis]